MPLMTLEQVREAEMLEKKNKKVTLVPADELEKMFELWMFQICWNEEYQYVLSGT